jgi:pimeloyl-ACP methyl ester carboxylesterase
MFLPADEVIVRNDSIFIKLNTYKISFKGKLESDVINGTFTQGMGQFPLTLKKGGYEELKPNWPQEPQGTLTYQVQEVKFQNKMVEGVTLAGTLTLPANKKNPPVAILISGSGPQNRDEELAGHKPFLVWADHLSRNGIAVLRYDDRGTAQSTGDYSIATSADLATDVRAAVEFLKSRNDINPDKIGLIGHSEGGLIAPMVITAMPDDVAFFVSLAGSGILGYDVLVPQLIKSSMLSGFSKQESEETAEVIAAGLRVIKSFNSEQQELKDEMFAAMKKARDKTLSSVQSQYTDQVLTALSDQFSSDWMRFFISHDPSADLKKVKIPSLLLNGSLDYQVIPEDNLYVMESLIKSNGNPDVTAIELEGMNHLFQKVETGAASEYESTEETVNQIVLELVSSWINERFQ